MSDYQTILNEVFDEFGIVGSLDEALDILKNSNLDYELEGGIYPKAIKRMLMDGEDIMIMTPQDHDRVAFTAIYKEEHGGYDYITFEYDTDKVEGTLEEMGDTTRFPQSFFDAKFTMTEAGDFVSYQVSPYDNELVKFLSSLGGRTRNITEDGQKKQFVDFYRKNIHDEYNNKIRVYHSTNFKMLSLFQPINMAFPQWLKKSLQEAFESRKL